MALLNATFRAASLSHDTSVNIILPENGPYTDIPTVYLLHGMHGNHASWCRKTGIEHYAEAHHVAVVMPDGENSFYCDMKYGKKYFTFVADELVSFCRRTFRLSEKREKNFICGLSMGGYGAFKLALRRPEQYAACASLSGCVDLVARFQTCTWTDVATANWGENFKTDVSGTDDDLLWLIRHFPADAPKPRLFASCGKQDGLYQDNLAFRDFMADKPFDFTFEDGDGVHNWVFWDKWVERALDFMLGN